MTNEQTFSEYIDEMAVKHKADTLSVEWVKWMLGQLESSNRGGHSINPAWLRASGKLAIAVLEDKATEPPMFIV